MGKSKELAELGDVVTQSGGNVGIGTGSPTTKLDVNGSAYIRAGSILGLYNTDNTNQYQIYNGGSSGTNIGQLVFTQGGVAERMRIDASGRVTMPYQPHISGSPNNSVGYGIADAFYTFNTPVGLSFSNSRITVPIGGNYMICWNTITDSGTGRVDTYIRLNGSQNIANGMADSNYNEYRYRGISVVVKLAANDYIQFEHQDYYNSAMTSFDNWNHASVTFLG